MTYTELIKSVKAKQYHPVYFLYGPEAYYIDLFSKYMEENVLPESEKAFNQLILYGKDTDSRTLIDTASRYPMMAPYQLVILKEAQEMKTLQDLLPYIEKPVSTTILVICHKYKSFDKRTRFAKAIVKNSLVFESKKIYDNKMPDWVASYLKRKKLNIDPEATTLIAEYLGTNLSKVSNELDKMAINVPTGSMINTKMVQDNIGISKDYNVFELQKALGSRNPEKTQRIINYFIANPRSNPPVVVIATLYNFFSKVYKAHFVKHLGDHELVKTLGLRSQYFLKDYKLAMRHYNRPRTEKVIEILREYDLKSKGVNNVSTSPGELLKEMAVRILMAA